MANIPPLPEHYTPRAVIEEMMRRPVLPTIKDALVFDPASGVHPAWSDLARLLADSDQEGRGNG